MEHVFISYSHVDSDFAEILQSKLESSGMPVWIDHAGIKAGTDWRNELDGAIRKSKALVLVMSPDSLGSHYVTYEWSFAHGLGKPIIPLMYRKAQLHTKLSTLQYMDFTHRTLRPWEQLVQRIKSIV